MPKDTARILRRNQTEAEKKLWRYLRSRVFQGVKFRRQQPLDQYVVDFCSFEMKVVVELDGGQHALNQEEDAKRTEHLKKSGYKVFRFWNNEVLENIEGVLEKIKQNIKTTPHPTLSRKGRGRKK